MTTSPYSENISTIFEYGVKPPRYLCHCCFSLFGRLLCGLLADLSWQAIVSRFMLFGVVSEIEASGAPSRLEERSTIYGGVFLVWTWGLEIALLYGFRRCNSLRRRNGLRSSFLVASLSNTSPSTPTTPSILLHYPNFFIHLFYLLSLVLLLISFSMPAGPDSSPVQAILASSKIHSHFILL